MEQQEKSYEKLVEFLEVVDAVEDISGDGLDSIEYNGRSFYIQYVPEEYMEHSGQCRVGSDSGHDVDIEVLENLSLEEKKAVVLHEAIEGDLAFHQKFTLEDAHVVAASYEQKYRSLQKGTAAETRSSLPQ